MAGISKTTLHIFLDTNALFTEAADRLIAVEIGEFILKSFDNDLSIRWYIPSVVVGERRYQMFERAKLLLPHLEKIERLLGHNLGITDEVLAGRVDEAIKRQIDLHKLEEVGFDQGTVDWQEMVQNSILRRPPFAGGEGEKGFRDAIVLETFWQHASALPKSSQACRIVLLSSDERLVEAAQKRMVDRNNVTFARDLDAVKTIINALASEITQETVSALLPRATVLFFTVNEQKSLYYSEAVGQKIESAYTKELAAAPEGFNSVTRKIVNIIQPPTFIVKEGQRLTFLSRIIFRQVATKLVLRSTNEVASSPAGFATGIAPPGLFTGAPTNTIIGTAGFAPLPTGLLGTLATGRPAPQYDEIKREGEVVFEVKWVATLTATGKLTRPKFLSVEYKGTNWKE